MFKTSPCWILLLLLLGFSTHGLAQRYPDKSVRLVVAFPTGPPYFLALHLAEKLRESIGQSIVPDLGRGREGTWLLSMSPRPLPMDTPCC